MKRSIDRLEAFSDGIMAIAITIMVLNIPLPSELTISSLLEFAYSIGIFIVSFIVVGAQWVKHHWLFDYCKFVSGKILWRNLFYLLSLSLLPLFTKWMMVNPKEVMPAICYDVVFLTTTFFYHLLQVTVIEENKDYFEKKNKLHSNNIVFLLMVSMTFVVVGISFYYPSISIIFFLVLPIVSSLLIPLSNRKV